MMPRTYTLDELRNAIAQSKSWNEVGRLLGHESRARYARIVADRERINYTHFLGQSWNKGNKTRSSIEKSLVKGKFVKNLRARLIEDGVKEAKCERCGIVEWNGEPAPLELDHINGDNTDNRLENLRILCPNCHAQTPTWRRKKSKPH
ncbi:HNH endonuclease [Gordonia phage GodonK]|uniref:HNH endonuclease n=1 Tax=Gordonia phage GodonK TaxID=2562192 RepID=A0A4D6E253_9CAUD|nr:HNH endonuclease [Gordonia phage GodonK]QBZ72750.1 HNH endonuclease [Gordonia phage GodonK]